MEWPDYLRETLVNAVGRAKQSHAEVSQICGVIAQEYIALCLAVDDPQERGELLRLAAAECIHAMLFIYAPPKEAAKEMDEFSRVQLAAHTEMARRWEERQGGG